MRNIKITFIFLLFICNIKLYLGFNFKKIFPFINKKNEFIDLGLNLIYNTNNNIEETNITAYKTDDELPILIINNDQQTDSVKAYIEKNLARKFNYTLNIPRIIPIYNKIDVVSFTNKKHNNDGKCLNAKSSLLVNIVNAHNEKNDGFLYFEDLSTNIPYKINQRHIRYTIDDSTLLPVQKMFVCINDGNDSYLVSYNDQINKLTESEFKGKIKTLKVYGENTRIFVHMDVQAIDQTKHLLLELQSKRNKNYFRYDLALLYKAKKKNSVCTFQKITHVNTNDRSTYSIYCSSFQSPPLKFPKTLEAILLGAGLLAAVDTLNNKRTLDNLKKNINDYQLKEIKFNDIMHHYPKSNNGLPSIFQKYHAVTSKRKQVLFSTDELVMPTLNGLYKSVLEIKKKLLDKIKVEKKKSYIFLSGILSLYALVKGGKHITKMIYYKKTLPYFSEFYYETQLNQSIAVVDFTN